MSLLAWRIPDLLAARLCLCPANADPRDVESRRVPASASQLQGVASHCGADVEGAARPDAADRVGEELVGRYVEFGRLRINHIGALLQRYARVWMTRGEFRLVTRRHQRR